MKAIETKYKGYRFRSRLEARWAVFFDAIGMRWEYEPQGFDLGFGELYLPDFWLPLHKGKFISADKYPGAGYWLEVKGIPPTANESRKFQSLCIGTGHHGYIVVGLPGEHAPIRFNNTPPRDSTPNDCAALEFMTSLCRELSSLEALQWAAFIDGCAPGDEVPDLVPAIDAARSARFEFGESGVGRG